MGKPLKKDSSGNLRCFIRGMGSVLSLGGNYFNQPIKKSTPESAWKVICADSSKIAKDIRITLKKNPVSKF